MRKVHTEAAVIGAAIVGMRDMNASIGESGEGVGEALEAIRNIDMLNALLADVNLLAGNMSAAPSANKTETIETYKDEQKAIRKRIDDILAQLQDSPTSKGIKDQVTKLGAYGNGKTGIATLRAKELDDAEFAELSLEEARKLSIGLDSGVKQLVEKVQTGTEAVTKPYLSLLRRPADERWVRRLYRIAAVRVAVCGRNILGGSAACRA